MKRTQTIIQRTVILATLLLVAACTGTPSQVQLATEHSLAGTQIANLRATDSVQNARLLTTLDFVSTQVGMAATQSRFLKATLETLGTPEEALNRYQQEMIGSLLQPPTAQSTPTESPEVAAGDDNPGPTRAPATPEPTRPIVTMNFPTQRPSATIEATVDPDRPTLTNTVTASGVQDNDCALDSVSQFSADTLEIYVVATVNNAPANTRFTSRWYRGEELLVEFDYTPDFEINGECIWFFAEPADFTFTSGEYSVQMLINGEPASDRLTFAIQ